MLAKNQNLNVSVVLLISLGVLQLLIGISAVVGGWHLISDPSGTSLGLPQSLLQGSPFMNYLIPGIFLFLIIGVANVVASAATFFDFKYTGDIAVGLGVVLIVWIIIQMAIIGLTSMLQPFYIVIGLLETGGGLLARQRKTE